ncbi:MAG TPA: hypothetical protein VFI96_06250 [Longimicrobiaceae bacterium]|nr:hypothetical protein [Longimicrobiaceae bacterium]
MLDPLTAYMDDPTGATVHHPYSAFNQGWDAAEAGHPLDANPYRIDTPWGRAWSDGWHCFHDDPDDDPKPWEAAWPPPWRRA